MDLKENEIYILKKLERLSKEDVILAEEMVKKLGEWTTVSNVAKYLSKSRRAIYQRVDNDKLLVRKIGSSVVIYTRSIVLILEKIKKVT